MTTIHHDTRTVVFRMPVLSFGRFRGALVLERTHSVELQLQLERLREAQAHRRRVAHAMDRADEHRTQALGRRLGGSL